MALRSQILMIILGSLALLPLGRTDEVVDGCADYSINEQREIIVPPRKSMLGKDVARYYSVRRIDEARYTIDIPVRFKSLSEFDDPEVRNIDEHYRAFGNECFAKFSHLLKDSKGTELSVRLYSPSWGEKFNLIHVGGSYFRPSVFLYTSNIVCEEFIHEIFHLPQLVDLYVETDPSLDVSCRVAAKRANLMSRSADAFLSAQSQGPLFRQKGMCYCETEKCEPPPATPGLPSGFIRYSSDSQSCPPGYSFGAVQSLLLDEKRLGGLALMDGMLMIIEEEMPTTLLAPAQVRQVLFPNCRTKAQLLRTCSAFSTTGKLRSGACPALPSVCVVDDGWLD